MYKMIVFDCDGTLLDSSAMIAMIQKGYGSMFPQRKKQPYACLLYTSFAQVSPKHSYEIKRIWKMSLYIYMIYPVSYTHLDVYKRQVLWREIPNYRLHVK